MGGREIADIYLDEFKRNLNFLTEQLITNWEKSERFEDWKSREDKDTTKISIDLKFENGRLEGKQSILWVFLRNMLML